MLAGVPPGRHPGERLMSSRWQGDHSNEDAAFDDYMDRRAADPSYTFRRHLRRIGGAIEE